MVFFLLKQKQYISTHKNRLVGNLPRLYFISFLIFSVPILTDPLLRLESGKEELSLRTASRVVTSRLVSEGLSSAVLAHWAQLRKGGVTITLPPVFSEASSVCVNTADCDGWGRNRSVGCRISCYLPDENQQQGLLGSPVSALQAASLGNAAPVAACKGPSWV